VKSLLFGVNVSTSAAADADPVRDARAAETIGFDFVSASDHPAGSHPSYETWTVLTWIAASTSRIAVATRVLGLPFRAPSVVAKMAESLDRLSGGRLVLGIGAGGNDDEARALGVPSRPAREKIVALADAVTVIRGLWREPSFRYDGAVYRVDGAQIEPKPAHRIPIWLGTFGDRALEVTGRLADGWIPTLGYMPADRIPAMLERVRDAARASGREPAELTYVLNSQVSVDDGAKERTDALVGPPERIAERLAGYAAMGFDAFNFIPIGDDAEQAHRLGTEVVPLVRELVGARGASSLVGGIGERGDDSSG
jgi:probable F420-dependent oxidoreductase